MNEGLGAYTALRGLARRRKTLEECDICGKGLGPDHSHLFDAAARQVVCACGECAVSIGERTDSAYRRVPRNVRRLTNFELDDRVWAGLLIPVDMAFFFYNTPAGRVLALYPSPAGATESLLELEAWEEIVRANPVLNDMQPDVQALLVNRIGDAREYYLAPLDRCYELVGLIRVHWRGLSGGVQVWQEISGFFDRLNKDSEPIGENTGA